MGEDRRRTAAREFSQSADHMIAACRMLEQEGIPDPPVEQFLRSLEALTQAVHRLQPPEQRLQTEPADLAGPAPCHVAARQADVPEPGG